MRWPELLALARRRAGLSQTELARVAGTSQPAISAYEQGRTAPSADTLERVLAATGHHLTIEVQHDARTGGATADAERSRRLYVAIVGAMVVDGDRVIARARRTLNTMRQADTEGHARRSLDRWEALLDGPRQEIVRVLLDPDPDEEHLASSNPFAGALTSRERWAVIRRDRRLRDATRRG